MIIDFHTHCFPEELAPKAIPALSECAGIPARMDGTIPGLKKSMKASGVDMSVVLSIATKPSQTEKVNDWSAAIEDESIIAFGSIHPDFLGWEEELRRMKALGLKGVKLHPDYQKFFVDEDRMFPIYEMMVKLGFVILFHAGVDIGLKPPYHCTPQRMARVLDAFYEGKFVAAHMGGYGYWDEVEKYLVGKNVYFDTSYSMGKIPKEQMKRIIMDHCFKKILFATDTPWTDQGEEIRKLKAMELGQEIENAIFFQNAKNILQL